MARLIGQLLRALGDAADEMDCPRIEDMMLHMMQRRVDGISTEDLRQLRSDMEQMQRVIGRLGMRVEELENENGKGQPPRSTIAPIIKMKGSNEKKLHR